MLLKIDNLIFIDLIEIGIKNLDKHRNIVNDLNVFPVPDGDTGTNMVMTLKYGYEAIKNKNASLADVISSFATGTVFGARGNSGVIVSQFFKGIADGLKDKTEINCKSFALALGSGVNFAYASVAKPVEGTILTVLKDATKAVIEKLPIDNFDELFDIFLSAAKISLEKTPEFLPILKKAGVVDSGGAGMVYFFEGISKYLKGEKIEDIKESAQEEYIDLSLFNKDTNFEYGYCIEGILQLTIDLSNFDLKEFSNKLSEIGKSIVTTQEKDKVKLHVHAHQIGEVTDFCQEYGEFLKIKIENMTVQNVQKNSTVVEDKKFLYIESDDILDFAIISVANNSFMQQKLFEIGSDVVIKSDIAPSAQDFIDAFSLVKAKKILVFPNSSNSILTSMKAGSMYKKAKVTVLNCRSIVECYASLLMIDYEDSIDNAIQVVNDTISRIYQLCIYQANKDFKYGRKQVKENEFFALCNQKILNVATSLDNVTVETVKDILENNDYSVITLYYGSNVTNEYIEYITDLILKLNLDVEVASVETNEAVYCLTITFE